MSLRVSNGNDAILAIVEPLVDQGEFEKMDTSAIAFKLKRVLVN